MATAGSFLQIISFIVGILGTIGGIAAVSDYRSSGSAGYLIVGSLLSWILLFGIGSAFVTLSDMAQDTRRSADANERTAQAVEQLLLRDIYAPKPNDAHGAVTPQAKNASGARSEALSLIQDIESSPSPAKTRGTILRRLDEGDKSKKSRDSK